jgi:dTDP-4-amino-4,6-dideoxygalactose transaminase
VYQHLGLGTGSFRRAERAAEEIVSLPMYPGLEPAQVDEVAGAVLQELDDIQHESHAG